MQRSPAAISASLKKVPPFPPVAVKLLGLLSCPAVDTNEVADLIASDATFTARLLQRVNSAEFGFASDITSVRRAIALLGLDTTRQVMLAHATAAYAQGGLKTGGMRRCWQHTVATAVLADEIATACGAFMNEAFTAGIMHDIGRLGLLVAYPQEYEIVIRTAAERSLDVLDFETEEFGMHHGEAGRMLAETWGLPAEILSIAGRHHDPCEGVELNLLRIVHVACHLADVLGYEVVKPLVRLEPRDVLAELPLRAQVRLTQSPEVLARQIEERIQEFGPERGAATPEETLALLAAARPAVGPEPAAGEEQSGTGDGTAESEPALVGLRSEGEQNSTGLDRPIVFWIAAAVVAVVAAALWILR